MENRYLDEKLVLCLIGLVIVTGIGVLCALLPSIQPIYMTLVGAVCTLVGIYSGAHVGNKFVENKWGQNDQESEVEVDPEDPNPNDPPLRPKS